MSAMRVDFKLAGVYIVSLAKLDHLYWLGGVYPLVTAACYKDVKSCQVTKLCHSEIL